MNLKLEIMILFIIYTFLKKYSNRDWIRTKLRKSIFFKVNIHRFLVSLLIVFMLFMSMLSNAQNFQLNYKIVRNGVVIGWLRLDKNTIGNKSVLLLVSEIKTKIIFPISVFAKESSTFENGKLIYSSQIRKTNGNIKWDKQTKLTENEYEVTTNGEKEKLSISTITENLLSLYFQEPIDSKLVYCDNQQCFVKIARTNDDGYKVAFPNGNANYFYYKDGICTKIKIVHTLYSAEVFLNPINNSYANNR